MPILCPTYPGRKERGAQQGKAGNSRTQVKKIFKNLKN